MSSLIVEAKAKINLALDVIERRSDGYHNILTVMQSISLSDRLRLKKTKSGFSFRVLHARLPCDRRNLAYRAAEAYFAFANTAPDVEIVLEKRIPLSAGLGGGSADAAAVLVGLNRLYSGKMEGSDLMKLAQELGSDVPFSLKGGTMLASGRGEKLQELSPLPKMPIVLLKPPYFVSTQRAYQKLQIDQISKRPNISKLLQEASQNNWAGIVKEMINVFEEVTFATYPELASFKEKLCEAGALHVFMTGSGPTLVALTETESQSDRVFAEAFKLPGQAYQSVLSHSGQEIATV